VASLARSPWLTAWLVGVLVLGVAYSFSVRSSSLLPGELLLVVGVAVIFVGGVLGNARTGRWFSWQGRVVPSNLEWFLGLTGAVLFVSPLLHLALVFLASQLGLHAF
jgi:hypothetical protein